MDGDRAGGLPVAEAARRLGLTENALRKRIRRGSVASARGADGRVYVFLPEAGDWAAAEPSGQPDQAAARPADQAGDLVDQLRSEVGFLRDELATRTEELRRRDHIIAALTERLGDLSERIPALGAGHRNDDVGISTEPPAAGRGAAGALRRLRRWLGGR